MKHLKNYIYESIFDNDIIQNTDELEKSLFNDYDSDFWKFLRPIWSGNVKYAIHEWERINKSIDPQRKEIKLDPGGATEFSIDGKVSNPFPDKYSLYCPSFCIGSRTSSGPHPDPIADGAGFKEINCNDLVIDGMAEKLGGFKFNITEWQANSRQGAGVVDIHWASDLDYFDAEINFPDSSYPTLEHKGLIRFGECWDFPNLKNITSNCEAINMYSPSLFDNSDIKNKLDKFFGEGEVSTFRGDVKKKNLRNIVAIANNLKKYGAYDQSNIKPVGKISDLIDLKGFKNVNMIKMSNNNVEIVFVKDNNEVNKSLISRHARYLRINDNNREDMQYYIDKIKNSTTADGWAVLIEKKYY